MVDDLAVVEVERRVLHQQPDQLAVGDVDHRLAHARGSRSRPPRRAAAAPRRSRSGRCRGRRPARPPRTSRACRCARWPARTPTRARASDAWSSPTSVSDHGSIGKVRASLGHAVPPAARPGPWTTTSAPCAAQLVGVPDPVDPDDVAEVPRPARRPPRRARPRRRRPARGSTPSGAGAGEEGVRRGLAAQAVPRGDHAVDPGVDQVGEPGGGDHLLAVGRGGDHRRRQPGLLHRPQVVAPSPGRPPRRARRAPAARSSFLRRGDRRARSPRRPGRRRASPRAA